jgi:hypothetical protein
MNFICPICDGKMSSVGQNLIFCGYDNLYECIDRKEADYNADYLLHYKLYGRTTFGKALNKKRWSFVLNNTQTNVLLDFGCGADSFSDLKPNGIKVFSYDPYFKKDFSFLHASLDTVTFWDSFEHITRLGIVPLLGAKQIVMSIPIIYDGLDICSWKHFRPGEHIWYFSQKALIRLMQKWGYKIINSDDFESVMGREDIFSYCFLKS